MAKANIPFFRLEEGTLGIYLNEISKYRPLSTAEESEVAARIREGDEAALEKLIRANLRFVVSVARNYQNQGMTLVDLINEGNVGLVKAARRFDENKNFKFISYAVWWVRQAILKGLADHSRTVRMPANRAVTIHRVGKARAELEQQLHRLPQVDELSVMLDMDETEVAEALRFTGHHISLDAPFSNDSDGGTLHDMICDELGPSPDSGLDCSSREKIVASMLAGLARREQDVVRLYFGIGGEPCLTLAEIGERLGFTRERIRQIRDSALEKLKNSRDLAGVDLRDVF